jgi:hypothetical protein
MRQLLHRAGYPLRHRQLESDLIEELEFHRAMKQRELEDHFLSSIEAGFAARRALGSFGLTREDALWVWP